MPHDVFVSYRSEDKAAAERLCAGLEKQDIPCWIAPRNIPVSTEWPAAIVEAINGCKVFVIVLSSNSKNAKQISREAELADKNGCQIITFRLEDVDPPPGLVYFLGNIQWLDAFGDRFDAAVAQVAQLVKKVPAAAPARPPQPAPAAASVPVSAKSNAWISFVSVGTVLLVGIGTWFFLHRPAPAPTPDALLEAKAVADRFLNERENGNLEAAWAEFASTAQRRIDKANWLKTQEKLEASGKITNHFNGCTPEGSGYECSYTLMHGDGTSQSNKIGLIRNQAGGWSVASAELTRRAK
jgi:hypothetical protein